MTIPTRQAPPPPVNSQFNRNFALSATPAQGTQRNRATNGITAATSSSNNPSRYTPTTDWDDKPFTNDLFEPWGSASTRQAPAPPGNKAVPAPQVRQKKLPPPRPPPPRVSSKGPAPKKPSSLHSNTILANLLSRARLSKSTPKPATTTNSGNTHKMPAPPVPPQPNNGGYGAINWSANLKNSASFSSTTSAASSGIASSTTKELISFDSPPSSPTFTQKSNSDCVSVDSFSSDSNYSPNNGFSSQAESGFEDDFALTPSQPRSTRSTPIDPFDLLEDPFTAPRPTAQTNTAFNHSKPAVAQKPMVNVVGNASFFTTGMNHTVSSSSLSSMGSASGFNRYGPVPHDTLCNGKNLIEPPPSRALPTIIRPAAGKPRISPTHTKTVAAPPKPVVVPAVEPDTSSDDSSLDDSIVSPPMPSIPPPAPPKEYFDEVDPFSDEEKESYGIALYDFGGEQDDDLPFRVGDKIYLIRQLNDQWYYGRDRRGCEGMFPMNYIDVKIPLNDSGVGSSVSGGSTPSIDKPIQVRALYDFHAETSEDLELKVS